MTTRGVHGPHGDLFWVVEETGRFAIPEFYSAAGRRTTGRSKRRRTLSIEGHVQVRPGRSGAATGHRNTRSAFDDRGHLIADRFGGPGGERSGNIVPMHALINSVHGPWYQMEQAIAHELGNRTGYLVVRCVYVDATVRPHSFQVTFRRGDRLRTWQHFNFNPHLAP